MAAASRQKVDAFSVAKAAVLRPHDPSKVDKFEEYFKATSWGLGQGGHMNKDRERDKALLAQRNQMSQRMLSYGATQEIMQIEAEIQDLERQIQDHEEALADIKIQIQSAETTRDEAQARVQTLDQAEVERREITTDRDRNARDLERATRRIFSAMGTEERQAALRDRERLLKAKEQIDRRVEIFKEKYGLQDVSWEDMEKRISSERERQQGIIDQMNVKIKELEARGGRHAAAARGMREKVQELETRLDKLDPDKIRETDAYQAAKEKAATTGQFTENDYYEMYNQAYGDGFGDDLYDTNVKAAYFRYAQDKGIDPLNHHGDTGGVCEAPVDDFGGIDFDDFSNYYAQNQINDPYADPNKTRALAAKTPETTFHADAKVQTGPDGKPLGMKGVKSLVAQGVGPFSGKQVATATPDANGQTFRPDQYGYG